MLSLIFENLYLGVLEINLIFKVGFYSIDKARIFWIKLTINLEIL
jgi:hypothetical protein